MLCNKNVYSTPVLGQSDLIRCSTSLTFRDPGPGLSPDRERLTSAHLTWPDLALYYFCSHTWREMGKEREEGRCGFLSKICNQQDPVRAENLFWEQVALVVSLPCSFFCLQVELQELEALVDQKTPSIREQVNSTQLSSFLFSKFFLFSQEAGKSSRAEDKAAQTTLVVCALIHLSKV